jgi:hypothetical protein
MKRTTATIGAGLFLLALLMVAANAWGAALPLNSADDWVCTGPATLNGELKLGGSETPDGQAWAIAPAAADIQRGKPFAVDMTVQGDAGAEIAVAVVTDATKRPRSIWRWVLPGGNDRHDIHLVFVQGAKSPRIAFGNTGKGAVTVSRAAVEQTEIKLPARADTTPFGEDVPKIAALLADWTPVGTLDGHVRDLVGDKETVVDIDGMEVGFPAEVDALRGQRTSLLTFVVNRGDNAKKLTVTAIGGPQIPCETRDVDIPAKKTTQFHALVQCLTAGDQWVKLELKSGDETRSVPLKVHCTASYPAFGASWPDPSRTPSVEALAALGGLPVQLHEVALPADAGAIPARMKPFADAGAEIAVAIPRADAAAAGALAAAAAKANPKVRFYIPSPTGDAKTDVAVVQAVVAARKAAGGGGFVISPVYDLVDSGGEDAASPALLSALDAGLGAQVAAIAVHGRPQPSAAVLLEEIDRRRASVPNLGWRDLDRANDLGAVRGALVDKGAGLPMLLCGVGGEGTGDARADTILLARRVASAFYRGATGVTLSGQAPEGGLGLLDAGAATANGPFLQAARQLAVELSSAAPVASLADVPGFSSTVDAPIIYKPFLRGREGIVVLWNNTGVPQDVAVEVRSEPLAGTLLRLSYTGDLIQRKSEPMFQYSEDAVARRQRAVYLTIAPLDVVCLSLVLSDPHAAWLNAITTRGKIVPRTEPLQPAEKWWDDYLKQTGSKPDF